MQAARGDFLAGQRAIYLFAGGKSVVGPSGRVAVDLCFGRGFGGLNALLCSDCDGGDGAAVMDPLSSVTSWRPSPPMCGLEPWQG